MSTQSASPAAFPVAASSPSPEQVRRQAADCILVVGSDPFSSLPQSLLRRLQGVNVNIVCLDHFPTLTAEAADVVIPTGVPGVESGGSVVRLDGDRRRAGGAGQGRSADAGSGAGPAPGEGAAMTMPQEGIALTVLVAR